MKKIFWLASYPKSGNTWLRAILSSIFFTKNGKFKFELLEKIPYFDTKENYEFVKKMKIDDFNNLDKLSYVSKYWTNAQELIKISGDFAFFKTHSANIISNNKYFYATQNTTRGVILVVRDPRDIAVSYSKHQAIKIDEVISNMINSNIVTRTSRDKKGIPMAQLTWEQFYRSWLSLEVPKLLLKYEDMLDDPNKTLENILTFFRNNYSFSFVNEENLKKNIINTTNFKLLQSAEKKHGFKEATHCNFFRSGEKNQWKKLLKDEQIKKLEKNFGALMKEVGYI